MHLVVLGDFWPIHQAQDPYPHLRLNAPSGAGCFLTRPLTTTSPRGRTGLNAPSGSGYFLTRVLLLLRDRGLNVLMRLLVLGAF